MFQCRQHALHPVPLTVRIHRRTCPLAKHKLCRIICVHCTLDPGPTLNHFVLMRHKLLLRHIRIHLLEDSHLHHHIILILHVRLAVTVLFFWEITLFNLGIFIF